MAGKTNWPKATDYVEAVQNLNRSMGDEELRTGEVALNQLGLPMAWSGGVADVYRIHNANTGNTWALKCFTKRSEGQAGRYQHIATHLEKKHLPFMVDFRYLDQGIRIGGEWYPAVKMRWVEGGIRLNEFVEQYLDRPRTLKELLRLWVKMAGRLRRAAIGHCDLQHGNVLMVPRDDGSLALRLIDYDGVHVPALASMRSPELGHPAFQHPQRSRDGIYSADVDRFSHLVIYTGIHCLTVGREDLWSRFNNAENLLFREEDFRDPAHSDVFRTLWKLPDLDARTLVGRLALACESPLDQTPLLEEVASGHVTPLTLAEKHAVESMLGEGAEPIVAAVVDSPAGQGQAWYAQGQSEESPVGALSIDKLEQLARLVEPARPPEDSETEVPPSRMHWPTPMTILRVLDWPLAKLAGEENEILHNFLRILATAGLAILIYFSVNPPPGSRESTMSDELPATATQEIDQVAKLPTHEESFGEVANSIGMHFKLIPAGEFMMGSSDDDPEQSSDERPLHRVEIRMAFHMGMHEITQEQYERVMGENPSRFKASTCPVNQVSWLDATKFCRKLSETDLEHEYRLPTEAEWEYACRAGSNTPYSCGEELDSGSAWFQENSGGDPHPVGEKQPNAWGLYDMHGNVSEWCSDWYGSGYYANCPSADPRGPVTGFLRVSRGGSCGRDGRYCRVANRIKYSPDLRDYDLGFRVVMVPVGLSIPEAASSSLEPEGEPPFALPTPPGAVGFSAAYIIEHSVSQIVRTDPKINIEKYGIPMTAEQQEKVARADGHFLTQEEPHVYQVYCFPNRGAMQITWTGYGSGNGQIYFCIWNGATWMPSYEAQQKLRNVLKTTSYTETVSRPRQEQTIYVRLNCTSGKVFTDGIVATLMGAN